MLTCNQSPRYNASSKTQQQLRFPRVSFSGKFDGNAASVAVSSVALFPAVLMFIFAVHLMII
jgi:hypothetical protein